MEGIGPVIAEAVRDYFAEAHNLETVKRLREAGLQFEVAADEEETSKPLAYEDLRPHGNDGRHGPRRGEGEDRGAWRQGLRLGWQGH